MPPPPQRELRRDLRVAALPQSKSRSGIRIIHTLPLTALLLLGPGCAIDWQEPVQQGADGGTESPPPSSKLDGGSQREDTASNDGSSDPQAPRDAGLDATTSDASPATNAGSSPPDAALPMMPACVPTTEVCDGKDNDCDGVADDGMKLVSCWTDADGDGYAATNAKVTQECACGAEQTLQEPITGKADCADSDAATKPGAAESCDGKDNNCDGQVDEGVKNACGGCGELGKVERNAEVAVSAPGAKAKPGDECWFPRAPGDLGAPMSGKVNCLTSTRLYCFISIERCFDNVDNDFDGLVDECPNTPGAQEYTDTKYGDVTPQQQKR